MFVGVVCCWLILGRRCVLLCVVGCRVLCLACSFVASCCRLLRGMCRLLCVVRCVFFGVCCLLVVLHGCLLVRGVLFVVCCCWCALLCG